MILVANHQISLLNTNSFAFILIYPVSMGLAAAALYLSCITNGENKSQRDLAKAANVTEVTIRNRVKNLKLEQNIEL